MSSKLSRILSNNKKLNAYLSQTMTADRQALWRDINRIRRQIDKKNKAGEKPTATFDEKTIKKLKHIENKLVASIEKKEHRRTNLPELVYNNALPITAKKEKIIHTIFNNQVVIISGETGSGKTTQIPKFCLAAERGISGRIGCTQPRRIAAITIAGRIAEELGEQPGESVGYKIRFQDRISDNAYIKIMTDGILLAETQGDRYLNEYDTIIVDEAHERSLNIDFVLGILKTLIKKRKDLKLIITSATIDTEKFSRAFDDAPVIEVSGRMYPVDLRYFPVGHEKYEDKTYVELAAIAVDQICQESISGDILIFMPTEQDIRETRELIDGRNYPGITTLPLFARLSAAEQSKVYKQIPGRKGIIATNIAETSLTIPGIKFVVDTGLARISQYLPRSGTTALPIAPISQSSSDQRKGRCGRVENGICIRLFPEEDFNHRPLFTSPEILRANLAEVILRMIALKLGDISDFPFIDNPPSKSIKDGFDTLFELGAIATKPTITPKNNAEIPSLSSTGKKRYNLTEQGEMMARLPIDPRLAKILIQANKEGCLKDIIVIVSALSIQDPRERPTEKEQEADHAHGIFVDPLSDFTTLLNIWNAFIDIRKKAKSHNQVKKFCKQHFLSYKRMREWHDIHAQIILILKEYDLFQSNGQKKNDKPVSPIKKKKARSTPKKESEAFDPKYIAIHRSILSGYLSSIAFKKEKNYFNAAKEREVMIFPGSGLFNKSKNWVVAAEMVETSRLFARTVAHIDNLWIEDLGSFLCKYTYFDPHWERKKGYVVASCQVSLFGLIVAPSRPVPYGKINLEEATDIFIRKALVEGDVNPHQFNKQFPFFKHNQSLIQKIQGVEDRVRKRDILISDEDMVIFYKEKLEGVFDIRTLQDFLKNKDDSCLRMNKEMLLRYEPEQDEITRFPNTIEIGNNKLSCSYKFNPGKKNDGVTLKVPHTIASSIPSSSTEWLVPGLYREKITALIKGLPKEYRKYLVPLANTVDIIIEDMPKAKGSILSALSNYIYRRFGLDIPATAWPEKDLPDHLKMRIAITNSKGKEIRASRDTAILRKSISEMEGSDTFDPDDIVSAKKEWELFGLTNWDFPDLQDTVSLTGKSNAKWSFYPGLEKNATDEKAVNLRLFKNQDQAIKSHYEGIKILYTIYFPKELKFLQKNLKLPKKPAEYAKYFGGPKIVEQRLYEKVTHTLFHRNIRTGTAFVDHAASIAPFILKTGQDLLDKVTPALYAYHDTRSVIYVLETENKANNPILMLLKNLRDELTNLMPETFITLYDMDRLEHIVRYLKAVSIRAQRALVDFTKDQNKAVEVTHFSKQLKTLLAQLSPRTSEKKREAVETLFWLIEEFKVSLYAQELKTPIPISKKRLEKKIKEIERMI